MPSTTFFRSDPADPSRTDAALISADEVQFDRLTRAVALEQERAEQRRRDLLASPVSAGGAALARDQEVRRLSSRLRLLERHAVDLVLGRMVTSDGTTTWIGRLGVSDVEGDRLLLDWRTDAARPFFAATTADPIGLSSRRRYRWADGRVVEFWDELLDLSTDAAGLRIDADTSFLAELEQSDDPGMKDVLGSLAADQDAAVRASAHGALVVSGGPGTGKTVVALHRAAWLMSQEPTVDARRGGVLVLGPHRGWLAHVEGVLPALGEDGVQVATLADLVPMPGAVSAELDPQVQGLKQRADVARWVDRAVAVYEEPPTKTLILDSPWGELTVTPALWTTAFAAGTGRRHNEARDAVWEHLCDQLVEQYRTRHEAERWDDADWDETATGLPDSVLRAWLRKEPTLTETFSRGWSWLEPDDVVADLWSVPAYLRRAAPELDPVEVRLLQRADPYAFTEADLPLLDAARLRVGDLAQVLDLHREQSRARDAVREYASTIEHALAADLDGDNVVQMLRGDDLRHGLVDPDAMGLRTSRLDGPFAHVVVDEAQELTDAQWQMVLARCPSRSLTLVGDRTQSRAPFEESWQDRLERVGAGRVREHHLHLNYRTPAEIMQVVGPQARAAIAGADVPDSIRAGGRVRQTRVGDLPEVLASWTAEHPVGTVAVISADGTTGPDQGVTRLTPSAAKGLEFDLVVVVSPDEFGTGRGGAVDRYVAQTRATRELVVLSD